MTEEQLSHRFRNRRRMAWASFVLVALAGTLLVAFGLSSDARAARVVTLMPVLTIAMTCWTGVVGAYFGTAAYEHTRSKS